MTKKRITAIVLLAIVACCVMGCGLAVLHIRSRFKVATPRATVVAGGIVHFTFYQLDTFGGTFGHGCYEMSGLQITGLPPGAEVKGIEWISCHESTLIISTQPSTSPGVYRLAIRSGSSFIPPKHVTLEIVAPEKP